MHNVAILAFEDVAFFELGCAVELFALPRSGIEDWYQCDLVSFTPGPLTTTSGFQICARQVENLDAFSTLVIPSWPTQLTDIPAPIANAVTRFYEQGKRVLSLCSGAFLLAELGLFEGRQATTHWRYGDKFKSRYPGVDYVDDVLYVYDGVIGCSAGSSAAIDLCLEVIRDDYGYKVANRMARGMVLSAHRKGGQAQFAETPVPENNSQFHNAIDWALRNLDKSIDINLFAQKASMSRRTFDRKFRADFNITPKEWLTHQRLNLAKEILENQNYSIEKVAALSGFDNATTMRHHFRKEFGITPTLHRKNFSPLVNGNMVSESVT
ncbi:helix-turn-helix domain-containing protein [Hahella sp. NBU794]|uniref:helix-turn-helix domain-containing protein n=1 Tax=Hahella sp. NBU794 TaxID=3422590 RepID=UPI003D6E5B63